MAARRTNGEGSVYQRGKQGGRHKTSQPGQWVAVAEVERRGGKRDRREFTGATRTEAINKRTAFLAIRAQGITLPRGRPPTVAEWMSHWLYKIAKPKVEPSTWHKSYRQKTEDLIIPFLGTIPLPELDAEDIEDWHAELQRVKSKKTGRPRSASTITQTHRILSIGLNVALSRKRINYNPAGLVTPPKARRKPPQPLSDAETRRVLKKCETWPTGDRWIVAIHSCMRQGESLGMIWPKVVFSPDGETSAIRVDEELARIPYEHGCGGEDPCGLTPRRCPQRTGGLYLKSVKSEKSHRWVPVGRTGTAALRRQEARQLDAKFAAGDAWKGWEHGDLVWSGPAGQPIDNRKDWQDWQDLLAACRIKGRRTYETRHGGATRMLEAGVQPRVVQEILGHSSVSFTMDTYAHVRQPLLDDAAGKLDRAFGGG